MLPKYLLQNLFSLVLPKNCLLCQLSFSEIGICQECIETLPWQKTFCPKCAEPMPVSQLCGRCIKNKNFYDQIITPFRYEEGIKQLIVCLKFNEKLNCANTLSALLLQYLQRQNLMIDADLILPVPLHVKRLQERGFNQALEIAKPLVKKLKIPLAKNLLYKKIATLPQAEQNYSARQKNLKNVFALRKNITARHVLVIDDVVTTGATVNELAKLLKNQGVQRVTVLAIARTCS